MQKRHRIFVAINLPQEIKRMLAKYQDRWPELPAKWTPADNLHITLAFLGNLTDQELGEACMAIKEVAAKHASFDLTFNEISYGPPQTVPPRMVWAAGEKSKELSLIKHDMENAVSERVNYAQDHKSFSPHVTLARISTFAWRQIDPAERPEINEPIDATLTVESIEVMESELRKGGPVYTIIESFTLGN